MTPAEVLAMAQQLLDRPDVKTARLWPRAAALLARQALEQGLGDHWRRKGVALHEVSTRAQLICLPSYLDGTLAGRASQAWASLTRACHHHPYELTPGRDELLGWLGTVGEVLQGMDGEGRG